MRSDFGKRAFIVAVAICFGALVMLCAKRSDTMLLDEPEIDNPATTVEQLEEGVLYVGGQGKVYRDDFNLLLGQLGVDGKQVVDVIFGDGVTEIGYRILYGYSNLRTLYLGRNVTTINHSSIMSCDDMEYIFFPKGIERVGRDFMYRCDSAYLVTDGRAEDLPAMPNVSSSHILAGIDSYDELVAARRAAKQLSVPAMKMTVEGKKKLDPTSPLPTGKAVFFKGIRLKAGAYDLVLTGEGLDGIAEGDISLTDGEQTVAIEDFEAGADSVRFVVNLEVATTTIKFRLVNGGDGDITVGELAAYNRDLEFPEGLKYWWPETPTETEAH